MKDFNKLFIGSGIIAEIFLHALINTKGESPNDFLIIGENKKRCEELREKYGTRAHTHPHQFFEKTKVVVIAVDPPDVDLLPKFAAEIRGKIPEGILINCITPKFPIAEIEKLFPNHPVMRLLVDISAINGEGVGAFCCGSVNPADTQTVARFLLESFGEVIESENEEEFDKIADFIHAQSWWSYISANCMVNAGLKAGLTPEQVNKIVGDSNRGIANTMQNKSGDDILMRVLESKEIIQSAFKSIDEHGVFHDLAETTKMNVEEIQENLVQTYAAVGGGGKYKFHYKGWM